jgi:hypothetical protein
VKLAPDYQLTLLSFVTNVCLKTYIFISRGLIFEDINLLNLLSPRYS